MATVVHGHEIEDRYGMAACRRCGRVNTEEWFRAYGHVETCLMPRPEPITPWQ